MKDALGEVSVPDYGELILNAGNAKQFDETYGDVSVPDYGELILNRFQFLLPIRNAGRFPSPITGN